MWDYVFVGAFVSYKRPHMIILKPGRRAAVGRLDMSPDMKVRRVLGEGGATTEFSVCVCGL